MSKCIKIFPKTRPKQKIQIKTFYLWLWFYLMAKIFLICHFPETPQPSFYNDEETTIYVNSKYVIKCYITKLHENLCVFQFFIKFDSIVTLIFPLYSMKTRQVTRRRRQSDRQSKYCLCPWFVKQKAKSH